MRREGVACIYVTTGTKTAPGFGRTVEDVIADALRGPAHDARDGVAVHLVARRCAVLGRKGRAVRVEQVRRPQSG